LSSNISVRRTGLVVFSSRMVSVFTGLIFLLLMTHSLSVQQFGLWEVILDIVTFACYPAGLLVFWATREIARGRFLGRTAIWMNLAFSLFGLALYFLFSFVSAARVESSLDSLLLAILLVPIGYWNQAANAVVSGHRPIVAGYSVIASEVCKLAVAFPALLVFHIGIDGVIVSVMAANVAQAATSTFMTRDADALPFDVAAGKSWLARSWLPSLTSLPYVLGVADTYIASLAAGNTTLVGYYQAAFAVATIAGYSFYLASALYPLLLRGGSDELTAATLDLTLLFGVPMAVGAAALAKPILYVLRPTYTEASTALTILAFAALVNSVSLILDQNLMGRDKVDVDEKATFRRYVGSAIFFVSIVDLATALAYLVSIYLVVALGTAGGWTIPRVIEVWAVAQLAVFSAFASIKVRRGRRSGRLVVARSLVNYIIGSALMGAFLAIAAHFADYSLGTLPFAAELLAVGATGVAIYVAYVLYTEPSVRRLARVVLRPVLGRRATSDE
jgi:O-antigen/teichoic acid export membrane protein